MFFPENFTNPMADRGPGTWEDGFREEVEKVINCQDYRSGTCSTLNSVLEIDFLRVRKVYFHVSNIRNLDLTIPMFEFF